MKIPKISFQPRYNKAQTQRRKVSQPIKNDTKSSKFALKYRELRNKNLRELSPKEVVIFCTSIGLLTPIPFGFAIGFLAGIAIAGYNKFFNK